MFIGLVIRVREMGTYRRIGMDFRELVIWFLYQEPLKTQIRLFPWLSFILPEKLISLQEAFFKIEMNV